MNFEVTESTSEIPYDLLLTDASKFKFYLSVKDLHSGILDVPCRTFQKNVERISIMSTVPQLVAGAATRHLLMRCQATFNVLVKALRSERQWSIVA